MYGKWSSTDSDCVSIFSSFPVRYSIVCKILMHYYNFYAFIKKQHKRKPLNSFFFFSFLLFLYIINFNTHFSNRSPSRFDRSTFRGSNKSSVSKAFLYPVLNKLMVHLIRNNVYKLDIRYLTCYQVISRLCNDTNAAVSKMRDQK